jgi:hypothetical protein
MSKVPAVERPIRRIPLDMITPGALARIEFLHYPTTLHEKTPTDWGCTHARITVTAPYAKVRIVAEGHAVCHAGDTYDPEVGQQLALHRAVQVFREPVVREALLEAYLVRRHYGVRGRTSPIPNREDEPFPVKVIATGRVGRLELSAFRAALVPMQRAGIDELMYLRAVEGGNAMAAMPNQPRSFSWLRGIFSRQA